MEHIISDILPNFSQKQIMLVLQQLDNLGVEKEEDLQYVKEDDLLKIMKPIQARKLVDHWNKSIFSSKCAEFLEFEVESPLSCESKSPPSFEIEEDSLRNQDRESSLNAFNNSYSETPHAHNSEPSIISIQTLNDYKLPVALQTPKVVLEISESCDESAHLNNKIPGSFDKADEDKSTKSFDESFSGEEITTSVSSEVLVFDSPKTEINMSQCITSNSQSERPWVYDFNIPWDTFPQELIDDCNNGIRPSTKARHDMVRILVNQILKLTYIPRKKYLDMIAYAIVTKYPRSFKDVFNGDRIGAGHDSLTVQLHNRVDNVKKRLRNDKRRMSKNLNTESSSLVGMTPAAKLEHNSNNEPNSNKKIRKVLWFYDFEIPWDEFPEELTDNCLKEQQPAKKMRLEMIRILIDGIMERTSKPEKKYLDLIAYSIVSKYPETFKDPITDTENDMVSHSFLTTQMINRVQQVWRRKREYHPGLLQDDVASSSGDETVTHSNEMMGLKIPWHEFPPELIDDCRNGKMPPRKMRLEMVRVLVNYAMKKSFIPGRSYLDLIAFTVVSKYPASFKDEIDGEVIGSGHSSLTDQLSYRAENVRRRALVYQPSPTRKLNNSNINRKRKCFDFKPLAMTEAQKHKKELQDEYKKSVRDIDHVKEMMQATFDIQRRDIESQLSVSEVMTEWPFLFEEELLMSHFSAMLSKEDNTFFLQNLKEKSVKIYKYLAATGQNTTQAIALDMQEESEIVGNSMPLHLRSIELLTSMFHENISLIYQTFEEDTKMEEILKDLPDTPILLLQGDSILSAKSFIVCVEKNVVAKPQTFFDGIAYTFACYYVFKYNFPKKAKATLEFIQRYFAKINACNSNGEKRNKSEKVHPKVRRLLSSMSKFSWN